jgi:hypothetical protein
MFLTDDAHRMMSGTVAALHAYSAGGRGSTELREHCERLIVGLQDPYSRAMLTHLALNDWSEILDEELFPFRERLAIAFQFLDDKAVTAYLYCCMERAIARGTVDGVIVPGLASRAGLEILQSYVDRTGDVQSAAVLGSYVCPPGKVGILGAWGSGRVGRWVESYRDLLDGFQMFHCRVGFDIERGQVVLGEGVLGAEAGGWVPRQIMIRCNYCNKPVSGNGTKTGESVEVEVGQQKERVCFLLSSRDCRTKGSVPYSLPHALTAIACYLDVQYVWGCSASWEMLRGMRSCRTRTTKV